MEIDETNDFSILTSAGRVTFNFRMSGTYAFYFSFGCAQIYIKLCRGGMYHVFTRFFIPCDFKLIDISRDDGFLWFRSKKLSHCAVVFCKLITDFSADLLKLGLDFEKLNLKQICNNFKEQIELSLLKD